MQQLCQPLLPTPLSPSPPLAAPPQIIQLHGEHRWDSTTHALYMPF